MNKLGIGLTNVHRRIQLSYGEEYGLTIDSRAGQGTTVTMRMPKGPEIAAKAQAAHP